jgi:hypothetical protein
MCFGNGLKSSGSENWENCSSYVFGVNDAVNVFGRIVLLEEREAIGEGIISMIDGVFCLMVRRLHMFTFLSIL